MDKTLIVSLTTLPSRLRQIEKLKITLNSLLYQWWEDFEVHLNIPEYSILEGCEYVIPEELHEMEQTHKNFKIFSGLEDYGSHTKLIPTLQRVTDGDQIIITADDDLVYHPSTLYMHYGAHEREDRTAFGFSGSYPKDGNPPHLLTSLVDEDRYSGIIEGYKTCSYKRSFFDDRYFQIWKKCWCDDLTISVCLSLNNIKKKVLAWPTQQIEGEGVEAYPIMAKIQYSVQSGCALRRTDSKNTDKDEMIQYLNDNGGQL